MVKLRLRPLQLDADRVELRLAGVELGAPALDLRLSVCQLLRLVAPLLLSLERVDDVGDSRQVAGVGDQPSSAFRRELAQAVEQFGHVCLPGTWSVKTTEAFVHPPADPLALAAAGTYSERVRRIEMAGTHVLTGDDIAEAVVAYATALCAAGRTDAVWIPTVDLRGVESRARMTLGGSVPFLIPVDTTDAGPSNYALVRRLHSQAAALYPDNAEADSGDSGDDGTDLSRGYDEVADLL